MIGLGVGIDYALFIVTRHLEQRRDGMERRESIARSCASSGGAVVFAGCTVMVALLSLAVVNIPLVTTLGYTSALVVAVAVLAAIMLLRAILGIVGDRIDKLPIPLPHRKADDRPHGWLRWGGFVARHPLPRRSLRSSCWVRSRCRRSTSTSASRTTARCRRAPTHGGRPTG
jgi:putative drug exporter of the RND superfamily